GFKQNAVFHQPCQACGGNEVYASPKDSTDLGGAAVLEICHGPADEGPEDECGTGEKGGMLECGPGVSSRLLENQIREDDAQGHGYNEQQEPDVGVADRGESKLREQEQGEKCRDQHDLAWWQR